ncbi:MAG: hypothetical protein ACREBS_02670 [Nitrososphaerales archaeon]
MSQKPVLAVLFIVLLIPLLAINVSASTGVTRNSEMTNYLFSPTCQAYSTATIIDRYNTNFTVSDSKGLREWRVGFIASDAAHGYYVQSFFQENANLSHETIFNLWTKGVLTKHVDFIIKAGMGGTAPNRTIIAGDFVDFFINQGILQVFWYDTNQTIHNQDQIFSTNIQVPSNFAISDVYQIFTPIPGATSLKFTNFDVSVSASQISNIFPHIPVTFSQNAPACSQKHALTVSSNLCFDNPVLTKDSNGVPSGLTETMLSSDIG